MDGSQVIQGLVFEFFSQCIVKALDDFEQESARTSSMFIEGLACVEMRSRHTNPTMLSLDA